MSEPLVVVWRVTTQCDLACRFCAFSRALRRPRAQVSEESVLTFGRILSGLGRPVLLSWLGGEPLLWPPLWRVDSALRDWGLSLSLTTNGLRLDAAACAHLAEHYAQVTVSLDGLAEWHDHARGAPGVFERTTAGLRRLLARRAGPAPLVRVNTVLMRSNLADFPVLCELLAGWGVDEVTFNLLGGLDRPGAFYERERLRPADFAAFRERLPEVRARGLAVRGADAYLDRLAAQAADQPWPVADCGPGQHFLFIDEHGRAAPCSFTPAALGVPVAELDTIETLPALWSARRRAARPAPCADCRSTQVFGKFLGEAHAH